MKKNNMGRTKTKQISIIPFALLSHMEKREETQGGSLGKKIPQLVPYQKKIQRLKQEERIRLTNLRIPQVVFLFIMKCEKWLEYDFVYILKECNSQLFLFQGAGPLLCSGQQ